MCIAAAADQYYRKGGRITRSRGQAEKGSRVGVFGGD